MSKSSLFPWTGSKRRYYPIIECHIPHIEGTYFEPFAGSASTLLRLRPKKAVLSDKNEFVVLFYKMLSEQPESLMLAIDSLYKKPFTEDKYNELVNNFNQKFRLENSVFTAAAFFILMKCSFNSQFNLDKYGFFNTSPNSNPPKANLYNRQYFIECSHYLRQHVTIRCCDWKTSIQDAKEGDFVFLDPPYMNSTYTYGLTEFGYTHYEQIINALKDFNQKGIKFICFNNTNFADLVDENKRASVFRVGTILRSKGAYAGTSGLNSNEAMFLPPDETDPATFDIIFDPGYTPGKPKRSRINSSDDSDSENEFKTKDVESNKRVKRKYTRRKLRKDEELKEDNQEVHSAEDERDDSVDGVTTRYDESEICEEEKKTSEPE